MQPQAIKTRNRSQDEPMAEIESGETYSGIKFKGLNCSRVLIEEPIYQNAP